MKQLIIVVLLVMGAALLVASSLEDFRISFNEIGSDIDERVKVLRAENSDAILEMNRKMLRVLGKYTLLARDAIYYANTTIQLEEWLNDNDEAQRCFDWAYLLVNLYSVIMTYDIGWCAEFAQRETSIEAQDHFYAHAHYILRAGTDGRGRVLESFSVRSDEQLKFLEDAQEGLTYLWNNYKTVLKEEIAGHDVRGDQIAENVRVCMQGVLHSIEDWVQFIKDDLASCLADVETPDR